MLCNAFLHLVKCCKIKKICGQVVIFDKKLPCFILSFSVSSVVSCQCIHGIWKSELYLVYNSDFPLFIDKVWYSVTIFFIMLVYMISALISTENWLKNKRSCNLVKINYHIFLHLIWVWPRKYIRLLFHQSH